MRSSPGTAANWAGVIVAIVVTSCAPTADVTRDELAAVIERDGVPFEDGTIPDEVLDRLSANQVIVLGETHELREHWELVAALLQELQARGFRQLLIERPQMNDWILDDYYALGGRLVPGWSSHPYFERRYAPIRDLNEALPVEDRVRLRSVDVNEEYYGGAETFREFLEALVEHVPNPGPVDEFLRVGYGNASAAEQTEAIEALQASLDADRSTLIDLWGAVRYGQVAEMVEVERESILIRAMEEGSDRSRAREEVIKRLVDKRITECSCGTVINIGSHHAQKSPLMGTQQEWLGDYLVHQSQAVDGTVFVVDFTSAKIELLPRARGTPYDVLDTSPENELFRVMVETWPGETVFLPLDDALFSDHRVAVNSEETIYATPLKDQYDAIVQYGIAHRLPID